MKALWLMLAIMLSATCAAMADSPVMPYTVDVTAAGPQFVVRSRVANTPVLRFYTKSGTNVWNPSGYSGILFWSPSINDPSGYQINSTTSTSSYVDFVVPTNGFSSPCKDWYCAFGMTTGDVKVTYAEGLMTLDLSPEFTGNYRAARTALLDGNQYRWTNVPFIARNQIDGITIVLSNGVLMSLGAAAPDLDARADIAVIKTQKVDRVDTNGWEVGSHAGFGDHAALDNLGWVQSGHTNVPFTFAYFGADNAAYGLSWLEVISDLGPYFDEEGSAAAVSNAAWAQGWLTVEADTNALAQLAIESNRALAAEALLYPRNNPSGYVDRAQATQDMASVQWVIDQGYGAGGGITQLVATADSAGVPSQISAVKWGIGTNTTGLGGGSSVLPLVFTGRTYNVIYDDTNTLILTHANPGSGPNMAGTFRWSTSIYPSGAFQRDTDTFVVFLSGSWKAQNETGDTIVWEGGTPTGEYVPSGVGGEGTITAVYATLTNAPISGVGGLAVTATHLLTTPAATIIAGAARGSAAVTNGQTGVTLGGTFTGNGAGLTNVPPMSGIASTNITALIVGGTATITRAMGQAVYVAGGAPLTITVQSADWAASEIGMFALGVYSTGSVTFLPATMTNTQASLSTTATNNIIFFKGLGTSLWTGR